MPAYEQVSTLKPGNIVSAAVLDFFLSLESHQSQSSTDFSQRFHYLSQDTILNLTEELEHNRRLLKRSLTNEKAVDCPFLFLVISPVTPNTYFLVVFDFIQERVLVLGHRGLFGPNFHKAYGEWESWNGPTLWRKFYAALIQPARGFEEHKMEPTVYETDLIPVSNSMPLIYIALTLFYFQRDSHSGPGISGFVQLLRDGKWNWATFISSGPIPELSCDHSSREQMFYTVIHGAYGCYKSWKLFSPSKDGWTHPPDNILDELHYQPVGLQWIKTLGLIFLNQRSTCRKCFLQAGIDNLSSDDIPLGWNKRNLSPFTPGPPEKRLPLPDPLPLDTSDKGNESAQKFTDNPLFINFDDYGSAPLSTQWTPPALNTWTFNSSGLLLVPDWASAWKDRGYRLPPDFDRISSKKDPTDYISRLFPIEPSETSSMPDKKNDMNTDSLQDTISMSAYSMLEEAGRVSKTKASYDVFVRGKTRGGDFFKLDIEKDHQPLTREQISLSVDIDSIIWVTRGKEFLCSGALNLHLKPHYSAQLPFSANPAVYINLFQPPDDEAELKDPQSRSKVKLPLSSIPHMPFGYFGEATQQFNLYVFFPRMVHKNNNNNRAITIMPHELQDLWISEAVYKALNASMDCFPGISEYLPRSMDQLGWKARSGHGRQPTFSVSSSAVTSLLGKIHSEVLDNNQDLLSRFGSFFFVLDSRGIKTLTKQHASETNVFEMLQTLVPSLAWDHMKDRTNGELYLDLGISFHPINTSEPMVGLWKLSSLQSSYSLMGISKQNSKEYHHNTMQDYGGMKAQTSEGTRHHTHITKRISYNLHFEAVRQPGQQDYISTLGDAIRCNEKYVEGCQNWVKVLEAGEKHSYGVRDELRASAHVVNELFPMVMERVRISSFIYTIY